MKSRLRLRSATMIATGLITTGNPLASLAFGYGDNLNASSQLIVTPSVAEPVTGDGVLYPG